MIGSNPKFPKAVLPMTRNGKDLPFAQKRSNMTILTCDGRFLAGYYSLVRSQRCAAAYKMIFSLFRNEYPNIVYNTYYDQISKIAIDIVPECVDSMEAGEILFECINQAMDLSPEERRKRIQSEIQKAFHLEKNGKRPRWIQASQWPVEDGIPLKFISQKETGDQVEYQFMDVRNQKKRVITQFY
ncbi:MAG: hypothetical protein V8Q79_07245 [Christensenellales bacterium]